MVVEMLTRLFAMFVFQRPQQPPRRTRNPHLQSSQSLTDFAPESIVTLRVRLGELSDEDLAKKDVEVPISNITLKLVDEEKK
jgi:hypothetical protein